MKAKCYACDEKIDIHNKCRKRACRAQLERRASKSYIDWDLEYGCTFIDRTSRPRIPWISAD